MRLLTPFPVLLTLRSPLLVLLLVLGNGAVRRAEKLLDLVGDFRHRPDEPRALCSHLFGTAPCHEAVVELCLDDGARAARICQGCD